MLKIVGVVVVLIVAVAAVVADASTRQVTVSPHGAGLADFSANMVAGMEAGWSQSLDNLSMHAARETDATDAAIPGCASPSPCAGSAERGRSRTSKSVPFEMDGSFKAAADLKP